MKITGRLWIEEVTDVHPASIPGQHVGTETTLEKHGKLNIQIKKSEIIHLLMTFDTYMGDQLKDAIDNYWDYEDGIDLDPSDIEVEILND